MDGARPADVPLERRIAEGASYSIEHTEALSRAGITPAIPPPAHAVVHGKHDTRVHDRMSADINGKGIHALQNQYGYGVRSLVEGQIFCIKHCLVARRRPDHHRSR